MPLHLLNTKRLAAELAVGEVSAKDQAKYLAISFVIWALPPYLFIIPGYRTADRWFTLSLWLYEGGLLCLIYVVGTFFCLRSCTVDPKTHFMIDFGCLYAPVSISTLAVFWAAYHAFVAAMSFLALNENTVELAWAVSFLYSERFADTLRFAGITGSTAVVFYRVGSTMVDVATRRSAG